MFFFTINLLNEVQTFDKTLVELVDMTIFKTLDIRGLPFSNSYERTLEAIREVKINGVLELILDPQKISPRHLKSGLILKVIELQT